MYDRNRPPWCDGTIRSCLRCSLTDICTLPIHSEETEAMKIGESLDGKGMGGMKEGKDKRHRERYLTDEKYRQRKLDVARRWRARKKAEREGGAE